ncbi:MAG: hypothetical protein JZU52_07020 [Lamprocystis purpurea]|jgi:hypothetical protein|nr:hypothetical protein [Lamprocystis purpurea]
MSDMTLPPTDQIALAEMTQAEARRTNTAIQSSANCLQSCDVEAIFREVAGMTDWQVKKEIFNIRKGRN